MMYTKTETIVFLYKSNVKLNYQKIETNFLSKHAILNDGSLKLVDKFANLERHVSSTENDINTRLAKEWTAIDCLSVI